MPEIKILIAPPGAGKTTWAMRYIRAHPEDTVHISSDAIRQEIFGDSSCQDNLSEVFEIMQARAVNALKNGQNVIYDATNMTRKSRRFIIHKVPENTLVTAQIVWRNVDSCIVADKERDRTVGGNGIDRMVRNFQAPFYEEGFHRIDWFLNVSESFCPAAYKSYLYELCDVPQDNPNHSMTILNHCFAVRDYLVDIGTDKELQIAGELHDIGKPYTKDFHNAKGELTTIAHYYGHPGYSAWLSIPCLMYSKWEKYNTRKICWLIANHMEPYNTTNYYKTLPLELKTDLDLLHEADEYAR